MFVFFAGDCVVNAVDVEVCVLFLLLLDLLELLKGFLPIDTRRGKQSER